MTNNLKRMGALIIPSIRSEKSTNSDLGQYFVPLTYDRWRAACQYCNETHTSSPVCSLSRSHVLYPDGIISQRGSAVSMQIFLLLTEALSSLYIKSSKILDGHSTKIEKFQKFSQISETSGHQPDNSNYNNHRFCVRIFNR